MSSPLIRGVVALLIAGSAIAAPANPTVRDADVCTSPRIRRAWYVPKALPILVKCCYFANLFANTARHTLSDVEKKAYIDAELCLMSKPATLGIRGSKTKFDEFQAVHVLKMEIAHFTVRTLIHALGYV